LAEPHAVISFLSPCVLPLVPGYVSYVAGHSIAERSAGTRYISGAFNNWVIGGAE
jgi:cytochrome c-type biogenesis protein